MSASTPVSIRKLPTGVPGLDTVLGGGLNELSFNLLAGGPGTGKTTLAHQIAFANATLARPALVITVLGESTLKLLRYQQQLTFFDTKAIGTRIRLVNLGEEALANDFSLVLARIVADVEAIHPGIVIVDSFRGLTTGDRHDLELDRFVHALAVHLTTWDVTSLMLGEYGQCDMGDPVFTVADGVIFLAQDVDRNSVVRKLQVIKMRGAAPMAGLHTYRLGGSGLQVFPRIPSPPPVTRARVRERLSTGLEALDGMMGGGIPSGDAVMIAGPSGSGKTTLTIQFMRAAFVAGESIVLVVFEEFPRTYVERARRLLDLDAMSVAGRLEIIYLRPLDLSVDETLHEIREAVQRIGASRVVIDSLSGFEVALAPTFREDFAESLYRLVGAIIPLGVTVMLTVETVANDRVGGGVRFKNDAVSFLTDDIILQRYVEIEGRMRSLISIVKMRGSAHSTELRLYETGPDGIIIGAVPVGYSGLTSGVATLCGPDAESR